MDHSAVGAFALLPSFRVFQKAFERGDWPALLALVAPERRAALESDPSWRVRHAPASVYCRIPESETPVLDCFPEAGDAYGVESRWRLTPEGWRLDDLRVERRSQPVD